MKVNADKIQNRLYDIADRISILNNRIDAEIKPSEISKLEKSKNKLLKEKRKLINKLYPPDESDDECTHSTG